MEVIYLNLIHKLYKKEINKFPAPFFVKKGFFIIELTTSSGLKGYGEISSYVYNHKKFLKYIKNYFTQNLKKISIFDYFKKKNNLIYKIEDDLFYSIRAAIEQALIDIIGKSKKKKSFELFSKKKFINVYSSGGVLYENQEYESLIDELLIAKKKKFFGWKFRPAIPIKLSNHKMRLRQKPPIDIDKLSKFCLTARKIAGNNFRLMIDIGCRMKVERKSVKFLQLLNELNFYFIEEPFERNFNAYEKIKNIKDIKNIALGENFINEKMLIKYNSLKQVKYLQPDINLFPMKDLLYLSKKNIKEIIMHNWTNSVSFYSNINFALASNKCDLVEFNTLNFPKNFAFLKKNFYIKSGKLYLLNKFGSCVEFINNKYFNTKVENFKI